MQVYRIEKQKYIPTILDGIPGEKLSFRWNTRGHPVIYAAESRSLALVEKLANLSLALGRIPGDYVIAAIEIPDSVYPRIESGMLPQGWDDYSGYLPQTQKVGDGFLSKKTLACFVPSAVVKGEWNVLLNPIVASELDLQVGKEDIDARLVRETVSAGGV